MENEKITDKTNEIKERLADDIKALCSLFSISGFEYRGAEELRALWGESFDELRTDAVGNHILLKRCGRENASKILIDAHFDEVGMIVTEVLEGGFLRVTSIGGIDRAILQAADVCVYTKNEILKGVIISAPPHLRSASDGKLPELDKLLVDMGGYTKEELEESCPVGTPVGFAPIYSRFGEDFMAGKSLDDKACAAIVLRALSDTVCEELAGDVYVCLSAREETAHDGGVRTACFNVSPDYAMTIDVNLGDAPNIDTRETVPLGKGPSISYSAATDRLLTASLARICKEKEIAFTPCAAPSSTGTNATSVNLVRTGIPVVDVGLPIRNMHTYNEVLTLSDAEALYRLVCEFAKSKDIADLFTWR